MATSLLPVSSQAVAIAQTYAGLAIGLASISSILFITRIYARTRPVWSLGRDDWLAGLAFTLCTVEAVLAVVANTWAIGKDPQFVDFATTQLIAQVALAVSLTGAWTVAAIKISVAFLFLRFKGTGLWTRFIYAMIAVQVLTAVFLTIMQSTHYIPFNLTFSPDMEARKKAQVWSDSAYAAGITVSAMSNIFTDFAFSLLPIVIIRDIQRPRREKIIIGVLMGLGFVAAGASIAKTVAVRTIGQSGDIIYDGTRIGLWSMVEEQLGLIAACVPCLRALMQRVLRRFGVISTHTHTNTNTNLKGDRSNLRSGMYLKDASESQKEIVVVSEFRVEHGHSTSSGDDIELNQFECQGKSQGKGHFQLD